MKSIFKLSLLILTFISCPTNAFAQEWYEMITQEPINIEAVKQKAEIYFDKIGRGKHTGYKQYNRWLTNATMNVDKNGVPYTKNHVAAELKKFRTNTSNRQQKIATLNASSDADNHWTPMGPFYIDQNNKDAKQIARIDALAVEPINQQLLFAGSKRGGIWRSRDAGASWTPLGDQFDDMSVRGIGIDPFNINHVVYLNGNTEIFESLDQGDTWKQIANFDDGLANGSKMVKFHPTTPNTYFVTTTSGLLKTIDGGTTFTNVLQEFINDVFFKPGDVTTMYSAGKDFWKSTNSGETWTKIITSINASDLMNMTVTPADPNRVYVVQNDGNSFRRIYKSTNSGTSFEVMADAEKGAENFIGRQGWRCMAIMGSTTDPDRLEMAGLLHFRSDDGGATIYQVPDSQNSSDSANIHADVLSMTNVNGTLYATSDGGIFRSTDNGVNYIPLAGNGLIATEIYKMGSTAPFPGTGVGLDPDMVVIGCQDNGTNISKGVNHSWEFWAAGDGQECFIDYTNDKVIYGSSPNNLSYSDNGGASRSILTKPEIRLSSLPTPFTMDPIIHTNIYWGYRNLYISKNAGQDWENLTSGQTTDETFIRSIAIAPTDNNYIYFSSREQLSMSNNAQSASRTWQEVASFSSTINYVTIDPNDPLHVLTANTGSEIYETKDGGQTWNDISGNLPDIKANCVLMDNSPENTIYVGMLQGVYYKDDTMTEWELFGQGLPKADVRELEIHYQANKLRVATYGRGIWEIPIFGTSNSIFPEVIVESVEKKCSGDSILLSVKENPTWAKPISYQWFKNEVLIAEATSASYFALENANYTVKVIANKVSGTSSSTEVSFLELPSAPSVTGEQVLCDPGTVTLTATGTGNGTLKWYSDPEGTNELGEGNTFLADVSETSTYYVKEIPSNVTLKVGLENNINFNGAYNAGGQNLVIDVESEFKLNSVKVYAEKEGNRTFEVRDANAELLVSKTVFVETGESRVALGFTIPVGNDLTVGIEDDGLNLYRSSGDINYPFVAEGYVTIKGSTLRSSLYYSLYDWEIQDANALLCSSPYSKVIVTLENCNGIIITPKIIAETSEAKCTGESIQLAVENDASWETPITYQWFKNETLITGASNATYDALETANYTVKVTANGTSGTSAPTQLNFTETPIPPSVFAEKLCGAGTVTLTATGSGNGIIKWYSDTEGLNEIAEGNTYSVDIDKTTTFYVKEVSTTSCFSLTSEVTANILIPANVPTVSNQTICAPGEVTLTATTSENGTVRWFNSENPTEVIQTGNTLTANITNTTTFLVDLDPESSDEDCVISPKASVTVTLEDCNGIVVSPKIIAETLEAKCIGESIQLAVENDASWENPITYQWFKNDVLITQATNITYNAIETANYSVKVTANGTSGTSAPTQLNFIETPTPPSVFAEKLCGAGTVTLTATGSSNGTIKWYADAEGLNEIAEGNNYSVDIDKTTTFYVKEVSTTSCFSLTSEVTANILIPANVPTVSNQTICAPGEVTLTATTSENGTVRWYNNDDPTEIIQTGNTLITDIVNTTTFLVDLDPESSDEDCVISPKASVTVTLEDCSGIITPKMIAETLEAKCIGESIQLAVENDTNWETPINYQWFKNDVLITAATNITYNAIETANYSVKVTANGTSGTSAPTQLNFIETPTPPSVFAEKLCGAGTVTLTATGSGNGTIKWYSDLEGTNEIAEGNTYSVNIDKTSTFYVKEVSNNFSNLTYCFSANSMATATVLNPLDTPTVSNQIICAPGEVILTATTLENGIIRWYNTENPTEIIQTGNTLTANIVNTTTFLVDIDPENQDQDCASNKASLTITIEDCNGLTPAENEKVILYPNPSSDGIMTLKLPKDFNMQHIEITDILGRSLLTYTQYVEQINLSNFESGTYLVNMISDKGSKVFKVVVP